MIGCEWERVRREVEAGRHGRGSYIGCRCRCGIWDLKSEREMLAEREACDDSDSAS